MFAGSEERSDGWRDGGNEWFNRCSHKCERTLLSDVAVLRNKNDNSAPMTAQERLQVLARQLASSSDVNIDFDPTLLYRSLVHDNYELRQTIYEFICKVRCCGDNVSS